MNAGAGCRGAADELRDLSDHLKAPLIHSVKGKDIMAYDDPRWMGGIGVMGTKAVYDAVLMNFKCMADDRPSDHPNPCIALDDQTIQIRFETKTPAIVRERRDGR